MKATIQLNFNILKKILLTLALSLILISCEKDRQLIVENAGMPLLRKVLVAGVPSNEFTYTKANLINEEKSKYFYTNHNYNDRNLLTSSEFYLDPGMFSSSWTIAEASMNRKEWVNPDNSEKSLTILYEYNETEQLDRTTYIRPSVNDSEYTGFKYENGRISRQNSYWQNVLSYYIDYSYDEKGNLTKASKYYVPSTGIAELWTTTEYEFDNMHNPFQAFKRLMTPGKYTNPNNITKETYTIYFEVDPGTQRMSIINNTYEYNSLGYPTKVNGDADYVYR
jgi:hypothetical protein